MSPDPVTVVTGGSRGIGAAVALRLARAGHDLVLGYRSDDGAAGRLAADLRGSGRRCLAVRADVTREDDVQRLFAAAGDELGPPSGLVNSAGLTAFLADLVDTPAEVIRRVVDVNLVGTLLCCRRAAALMSDAGGGAIVNLSSAAATLGAPHDYVHYAAAKAGVEALTVGLAKELAPAGVRVNAVAPGIVATRIHADAGDPGRADRLAGRIPLGRPGAPEEIAAAVAWLLSAEASYTTGAVLRVAGGL